MDTLAPQGINAPNYSATALPGQAGSLDPTITAPTPIPPTAPTINSSNLAPAVPIPYTTPNPTPTYPVGSLDTTIPTPPSAPTPAETSANSLTSLLTGLNASLVGKTADQTAAEAAAGVPAAQKAITDLSASLTGLQNEAQAIPLQLQNDATGRGITAAGLAPIQSAQLRDNAVKALTVSTLLEAAKGNLANAQSIADKAIAQKYGPIQEQITAASANLQLILNSPEYTKEEKDRAQQQLDAQNAKQAALDKAKSDASAVSTAAITAAQYIGNFKPTTQYPSASTALTAIAAAKTPAEAAQIIALTGLSVPAKLDTSVVEVGGRKLLVNNQTGKTIQDLGAATVATGTAAERSANAVNTLQSLIQSKQPLKDGTPVIDANGFVTPTAWKALIAAAPSEGLTRADFIKAFGNYLYTDPEGVVSPTYGLTPLEIKSVTGTLPVAN